MNNKEEKVKKKYYGSLVAIIVIFVFFVYSFIKTIISMVNPDAIVIFKTIDSVVMIIVVLGFVLGVPAGFICSLIVNGKNNK